MPNLFPEGKQEPGYNTVDAALLFIIAVYEYYLRTGNKAFVRSVWSVMQEIVDRYETGTDFHIGMDEDGLIHAGEGFDQVTWMDVRVGDILPTPRHGKPVEINAYWYNALRIMDFFGDKFKGELPEDNKDYGAMAELTGKSFREKFWNEEAGCLKDVLSEQGRKSNSDTQIRCNQIWAVAQCGWCDWISCSCWYFIGLPDLNKGNIKRLHNYYLYEIKGVPCWYTLYL